MTGPLSVGEIADRVHGSVVGDRHRVIEGVSTPEEGDARDLVFVGSPRHLERATSAGALLVANDLTLPSGLTAIRVPDPAQAMAQVIDWMFPVRRNVVGVSPAAFVDPSATIGTDVGVGPFACIGADVRIGDRTEIHPSVTIGRGSTVGTDCVIYAGVHIYPEMTIGDRVILHSGVVIGADGFGFAPVEGRWEKIVQLGSVRIGNDVEIGANTCVDRGALDDTTIDDGVKLDNLIQIGHNVRIGAHTAMAGCAAVAGSTVIGAHCTIGGAAMIIGHVRLADHVNISGGTFVMRSIDKPGVYSGVFPIDENATWEKNAATLRQLHSLRDRLRKLEKNATGSSTT